MAALMHFGKIKPAHLIRRIPEILLDEDRLPIHKVHFFRSAVIYLDANIVIGGQPKGGAVTG